MKLRMRTKLELAICLPLLAIYGVMLAIEFRVGRQTALKQMELHLTELARHEAALLDTELSTVAQLARTTADAISLQPTFDAAQIEQLLRVNLEKNPRVFGMAAAFAPGMFKAGVTHFSPYVCRDAAGTGLKPMNITPADGYDYTLWDWYLLPKLLDRAVWTDPYYDRGAGNILMCTYSAPFYRQGRFCGVVTADLSLQDLRDKLSRVAMNEAYCFVISQDGTFISHPKDDYIMCESVFSLAEWHELPPLFEVGKQMIAGATGVSRLPGLDTGEPRFIVFAPIMSAHWSFAAVITERRVLAPVRLRMVRQMGLLIAGLLVLVVVVLFVSVRLTRPISRLAAVAQQLARGNLDVQVTGVTSRDEIGQFAETFNKMVTDLRSNVEERVRETAARKAVESELNVATEIQLSLIPHTFPPFPERQEFDLYAVYEPATFMAGDYYDFFFVKEDVLAVVIADVSGKGVPAAMFMAVVRTALRNFTTPSTSPAQVLETTNRTLVASNDKLMFVTLFYAHYYIRTGDLIYASAGHNPPYVVRAGARIESLSPTGPVLAVIPDAHYDSGATSLSPGDLLALYTDGVTEARPGGGELFGEARLEKLLLDIASQPLKTICDRIVHDVDEYRQHEPQDDVTLLVLKRFL